MGTDIAVQQPITAIHSMICATCGGRSSTRRSSSGGVPAAGRSETTIGGRGRSSSAVGTIAAAANTAK